MNWNLFRLIRFWSIMGHWLIWHLISSNLAWLPFSFWMQFLARTWSYICLGRVLQPCILWSAAFLLLLEALGQRPAAEALFQGLDLRWRPVRVLLVPLRRMTILSFPFLTVWSWLLIHWFLCLWLHWSTLRSGYWPFCASISQLLETIFPRLPQNHYDCVGYSSDNCLPPFVCYCVHLDFSWGCLSPSIFGLLHPACFSILAC